MTIQLQEEEILAKDKGSTGGSRSLGGKITDAILKRAAKGEPTREIPRDAGTKPTRSMQEKGVGGKRLGHKGGGRKKS